MDIYNTYNTFYLILAYFSFLDKAPKFQLQKSLSTVLYSLSYLHNLPLWPMIHFSNLS